MWPLFVKLLLFILGKKKVNQNDVEFDFSICHALALFPFFLYNKQKMYGGICTSLPYPPKFMYIDIFWT